jgi:hypothetical protein
MIAPGGGFGIGGPTGLGNIGRASTGAPAFRQPMERPHVRVTAASVHGLLQLASAQRIVRGIEPAIGHCYIGGLRMNPSLQGMMMVRLTILPGGNVVQSDAVANYLADATVTACITVAFRRLLYPRTRGSDPSTAIYRIQLTTD